LADSLNSIERKVFLEKTNTGVEFCNYGEFEFTTSDERKSIPEIFIHLNVIYAYSDLETKSPWKCTS
jgi:urate oxidase